MVKVKKMQAWMAAKEFAKDIISPPYDVLNTEEAKAMAGSNEKSFLHVNKPEIDLPAETNQYADEVYAKGLENLEMFKKKGWLQHDSDERCYLYRQSMGSHSQLGIMARVSIHDYENNLIKRHERTIQKKEADRTRLTDTQNANIGPVFLTFGGGESIQELMISLSKTEPYAHVDADDGVGHTLWQFTVEESDRISKEFEAIPSLYVADGHHRTQAAYNVGKARLEKARQEGIEVTGEESFNYFMTLLYPKDQLYILNYDRVVRTLSGYSNAEFLDRVGESFQIEKMSPPSEIDKDNDWRRATRKFEFTMFLKGDGWYRLRAKPEKIDMNDLTKQVDTQFLTEHILTPIIGIENLRNDDRIDFVGGIRGINELEKRCQEDCVAAWSCYPVKIDEIISISDAGLIMPPKTTWFEPKPRSGFVVNCFQDCKK